MQRVIKNARSLLVSILFSLTDQDVATDVTPLRLGFQAFIKRQLLCWKCILKSKAQELYTIGIIKGSIHNVFAKTSLLICMRKVLI